MFIASIVPASWMWHPRTPQIQRKQIPLRAASQQPKNKVKHGENLPKGIRCSSAKRDATTKRDILENILCNNNHLEVRVRLDRHILNQASKLPRCQDIHEISWISRMRTRDAWKSSICARSQVEFYFSTNNLCKDVVVLMPHPFNAFQCHILFPKWAFLHRL